MRRMFLFSAIIVMSTPGAAAAASAAATLLPAATITTTGVNTPTRGTYTPSVPLTAFGDTYVVSDQFGKPVGNKSTPGSEQVSDASGSAIVTASGLPYLSASITGTGEGQGFLTYSFKIIDLKAPTNPSNISVGISAVVKTAVHTSGIAKQAYLQGSNMDAGFVIDGSGFKKQSSIFYQYDSVNGCAQCFNMSSADVTGTLGPTSSFVGNITLDQYPLILRTDTIHTVTMYVLARAAAYGGFDSAFASVDPTFTVPTGYELVLSPGIGAVPEPATWALMIAGFGVLGVAMRRSRKLSARVSYA